MVIFSGADNAREIPRPRTATF